MEDIGSLADAGLRAWVEAAEKAEGPMRLSELALRAFELSEQMLRISQDESKRRGEKIHCRKGCGACCRQVVPISPPEALLLAEMLENLPGRRRGILSNRFGKAVRRVEAEMPGQPLFHNAGDYFRIGIACPFLERESCSIHPVRPLVCREHLAITPAAYCADFPNPSIAVMAVAFSVREALQALAAEALGAAPEMIPLIRAPEWAAENREARERTWDARYLLERLAELCLGRALFASRRDVT